MRIDAVPRTRWATASATSVTAIAPTNAAPEIPSWPSEPSPPSQPAEPPPATSTTMATPNEAPLVVPSTNGSASGLRNTVCMCTPQRPSAPPASRAAIIRGRRAVRTTASAPRSAWSGSTSARHTAAGDRLTDPRNSAPSAAIPRATTSTPIATAARRLTPTPCRRPAHHPADSGMWISTSKIVQICTISRPRIVEPLG